MSYKSKYDYLRSKEWYSQGGDMRLLYIVDPYSTAYKVFGAENTLSYLVNQHNTGFFSMEFYRRSVGTIIALQRKDKNYIDRKVKYAMSLTDEIYKDYEKFSRIIPKTTEKQLQKILKRISTLVVRFWVSSLLPERFDPLDDFIVKREVKRWKISISDADIRIMTTPNVLSFAAEEENELYEISLKPRQNLLLEHHAKKWFWIHNTWGHVDILGKEFFRKKMKELPAEKVKELKGYSDRVKKRKIEIIERCNLNKELQNVLYFFEVMSEWRDKRKIFANKCNYLHYLIAKRLSDLWKIDFELILNSYPDELIGWMEKGKPKNVVNLLKERDDVAVFLHKDNKTTVVTGEEGNYIVSLMEEQLMKTKKELTGQAGNLGKAIGKVKVIRGIKEFKKFEQGNILVAPNTRPEYVPIMKKAAAIVTDEGGITNHSAIVSRELGIPCIVGTRVASRLLKDGQLVEVDADNGIVRVLK